MDQDDLDAAVTEFVRAIGLLVRRLRAAADSHDLSWTQHAVLSRLDKEGPATTSDLARAEGMKPQSMGATIAALEEAGMVERHPHPTDGRQVHIVLSEQGAEVRKKTRTAKLTWLAQSIAQLDEQQQQVLFAATEIIKYLGEP